MIEIVRKSRALIFDGEGDKFRLVSEAMRYTGFLKLMEHQRGLLIAGRDLATKLKGSTKTSCYQAFRLF
jgi:hypothetical protein